MTTKIRDLSAVASTCIAVVLALCFASERIAYGDRVEASRYQTWDESGLACGCSQWYWAKAEYLHWSARGMDLPPLVTTSPDGTARSAAGVLGAANTTVLLGNERFGGGAQSGGRVLLGAWLDEEQLVGFDFLFTRLGDQQAAYDASTSQYPILARPFFNTDTNIQDSRLIGFPDSVSGDIDVAVATKYQVFEVLFRTPVSRDPLTPTYLVAGYRYSELRDTLVINESSLSLSGVSSGTTIKLFDDFRTRNRFNGFEVGLLSDLQLATYWKLSLAGKVAFGETRTVTTIRGETETTSSTGDVSNTIGGLLTQGTNIGEFKSNSHGVIQDFSVSLRRNLGPGLTANVGYGVHRWTEVTRASDQIDLRVNPTQFSSGTLVGEASPSVRNASSDFVAHGLTIGAELTW